MISKELDKVEHTAKKQSTFRMKEEELQHQDHIRRKLSLRRQIEEGWKTKEMLLLTKIGEEVKREARIEEQRHKLWEEAHRKKQALLEKKIAYHLQKMQKDDLKREEPGGSINENKGQDKREGPGHHSLSFVKVPAKNSSVFISSQHDVQKNKAEQKKHKEMTKTSHILNEGIKSSSLQVPGVSAKTNGPRHSVQAILKQEVKYADFNEERAKKSSISSKSGKH
uniref:Uncharacterized protein n=1 Tax=Panthera leo TaxID=9689 RepID=A0A8C8XKS4_PANLE